MKNKIKKIIYMIIIGAIVLGFSYIYAHIDKNDYIYNKNTDTSLFYGTGILKSNEEIKQTFVSEENTIDGINLKISTAGNVENVILHYAIVDIQTEERVEYTISAAQLENNKFNQLEIAQVSETEGKCYELVFRVENADEQKGISFYVVPGQRENQKLTVMGNDIEGTLSVRTICHKFDVETFVVLLGILLYIGVFMKGLYKSFR